MSVTYECVTRPIRLADLPSAVRNAIVTYSEHNKLQLVNTQVWLTLRSKPPAKSVLRKLLRRPKPAEPVHEMVFVVHSTHFIIGSSLGVVGDALARSVVLVDASMVPTAPGEEPGFTIHGFKGETPTFFMPLGPGADSDACRAAATKAIADAPAAAKVAADAREVAADAKAATKAKDASEDAAKDAAKAADKAAKAEAKALADAKPPTT